MTSGDAIPRAKIAEIVREEVREILSRSKGPFLPTTAPGGFRASVLKFSLPLGLLQYIVAPGLVGGIAALALLHFSSAPVPSQTNAAARSQTEQASDTTSVQSPGTAVAPQAETSSGGRETSQGASIPINQCDVATLRQAIDDLVTSMGTLKVQQKQVVDAIRTNLDRLKRSAAVAPEGSCKSVSPTGP
jgi:anti-sigma28 factor (negative regulator of flagellin synthesis)